VHGRYEHRDDTDHNTDHDAGYDAQRVSAHSPVPLLSDRHGDEDEEGGDVGYDVGALVGGGDAPPSAPPSAPGSETAEAARAAAAAADGEGRGGGRSGSKRVPLWAVASLVLAVCAMSTGGMWFALLQDTPPGMKAAWRLLLTAVLQLPGLWWDCRTKLGMRGLGAAGGEAGGDLARLRLRRRVRREAPLPLLLAGAYLAVHFGTWSLSLELTSLSHSLLFVCATPLLIVLWLLGRHLLLQTARTGAADTAAAAATARDEAAGLTAEGSTEPIAIVTSAPTAAAAAAAGASSGATEVSGYSLPVTALELLGTMIGTGAAAALALSAGGGSEGGAQAAGHAPTLLGDLVALAGAGAMVFYLNAAARLRSWMPLFVYAQPVTLAAGVFCGIASLLLEPGTSVFTPASNPASLWGFLGDSRRFGLTLGAALCSGILGHTLANAALSAVSPLLVSVLLLTEPIIGSILGYLVGVQGTPSVATAIAGPILLISAAIVTVGEKGSRPSAWADSVAVRLWQRVRRACGR
jgi:drug/metabolite transporter (DMT)-like permease